MASTIGTRLFLFQFLLIFSIYHYQTFTRSANDFKDNIKEIAAFARFKNPYLDQFLKQPESVFQVFLIINTALGFTSILGFKLCQVLSGLSTLILGIIYCNPLKSVLINMRKTPKAGYTNFIPSVEFLAMFALGLGMIANAFLSEPKENKQKVTEESPSSEQRIL